MVRQEVIARQIAPLAAKGTTILDVGCGQGTQVLRLASAGCSVTAVDPSSALLGLCGEAAHAQRLDVQLPYGGSGIMAPIAGGGPSPLPAATE